MARKNFSDTSDEQLVRLIRENRQSALEELFARYYHSLCSFAFHYVRDLSLTEEIVSDVFLNIWLKRHAFTIKTNLKAYLFAATRNQALNYLRKEKQELIDFDEVADQFRDHEFSADHPVRHKDFTNRLEVLLNSLPPRRAQVFRLSRIEGFTYREIATILSISAHTVQNHMVKAVKQLSAYLIEE